MIREGAGGGIGWLGVLPRLALGLLALPMSAHARETPASEDPLGVQLRKLVELAPADVRVGVLPSGMRLVVETRHDTAKVGVATIFPGGSAKDPTGREGAMHLAEHVWFRGAVTLPTDAAGAPASAVRDRIAALGGQYQGLTGPDDTLFATTAPSAALEALLALEELRLRAGVTFGTEADLEAERRIVARELDLRGTERFAPLFTDLYGRLYPAEHPYHRWSAQSADGLGAVTAWDVEAAGASWDPAGATLVLTGDLPEADALDALLRRVLPTAVG